jgi:hypothetical protein
MGGTNRSARRMGRAASGNVRRGAADIQKYTTENPNYQLQLGAVTVYDGLDYCGAVVPQRGRWLAVNADGRRIGTFDLRHRAEHALYQAAGPGGARMTLTFADIDQITAKRLGTHDIPCPECGPDRRSPANRKKPTMRIWRPEPEYATWYCARCRLRGGARADGTAIPAQRRSDKVVPLVPAERAPDTAYKVRRRATCSPTRCRRSTICRRDTSTTGAA